MEPTPVLIGLDIGLVLAIVYVLDRNVFHAIDLILTAIPVWIELRRNQIVLGVQLWLDRRSLRNDALGRFLANRRLQSIINNPDYQEFFREQVQSESLQERDD
jgi:hypothetical protein